MAILAFGANHFNFGARGGSDHFLQVAVDFQLRAGAKLKAA